ncbi:MAG: DUF3883 domain-containing protein [Bacteroidetes bacterium]|nr:DUF3883 domain-containing protein [Bacteroidota bacterium]
MKFEEVRLKLLKEAKASPNLLSDLAGLENYISESYHNRSFIELLQNADDANATKFKIIKENGFLYIANNGRIFSQQDFESLCRSASSKKVRGETIGYRGIGFKSVVGFSKEIHVLSGDLEISFSKEKTKLEIPNAMRVPLIRIPHSLNDADKKIIEPIQHILNSEGYTSIFVFTGLTANSIESEFNSFEYNSLLFLRNVIETEISLNGLVKTKITKAYISDSELKINFQTNTSSNNWLVSKDSETSIAFPITEDKITKLLPEESLVHAFLPTEDLTGLGVLINGNFSTDPSRRHLIFDNDTINSTKACSKHIVRLLEANLKRNTNESINLVNALIPSFDPRMIQFMKNSFSKYLVEEIKKSDSKLINKLRLCPSWLNPKDFHLLINANENVVNNSIYELDGFNSFIKYLGATEVQFDELISNINNADLSVLGCVQLTKNLFKSILSHAKINDSEILSLRILYSQGKRKSFLELQENPSPIDESFVSLLLEHGLTEFDIKQVLKKYLPDINSEMLFESRMAEKQSAEQPHFVESLKESHSVVNWFNKSKETSNDSLKPSIKRWRSAEEQALAILNLNGFNLEDVSKQNIGFDLEGFDPDGNEIQIEIKSISLPGQKFKLTNNEIAVAQEKQKSFFVAIVRQYENIFEIALIPDPVNNLVLNRQCVQWIWECEDYEYKPMKFEI